MSNTKIDNRFMEFRLGDQLYAAPLLEVKEVIQKPDVTDVPNMPQHFEGMINLRGQIIGVFNIRKRLGAKAREASADSPEVIIVVEKSGVMVGMLVDEVTRVLHPTDSEIKPAPLKDDDAAKKYVGAVIQMSQDLVLTVHLDELLELNKFIHKGAA